MEDKSYEEMTDEEFEQQAPEKIKRLETNRLVIENAILKDYFLKSRDKLCNDASSLLNAGIVKAQDDLNNYINEIKRTQIDIIRKQEINRLELQMAKELEDYQKQLDLELVELNQKIEDQTNATDNEYRAWKEAEDKYDSERIQRKKLEYEVMDMKGNIRVFCRIRPEIKEDRKFDAKEVTVMLNDGEIQVTSNNKIYAYETDYVFSPTSTQEEVYFQVDPFITKLMKGYNLCIFAYGQTGSGKTYTMDGPADKPGISHLALKKVFDLSRESTDYSFSFNISIFEIYNDQVIDLQNNNMEEILDDLYNTSETIGEDIDVALTRKGLALKLHQLADGIVTVEGLTVTEVNSIEEVENVYKNSSYNRMTTSHKLNQHSSRSHLIITLKIEAKPLDDSVEPFVSFLQLIDLAGSERVAKTQASGYRLKEAQYINKSLCDLSTVISTIALQEKFIPYRNCKLTHVLKNSISGNSKVLMFVNLSPCQYSSLESISSLEFATKCRNTALSPEFRIKPNIKRTVKKNN